jgi:transcription termination factor NusB
LNKVREALEKVTTHDEQIENSIQLLKDIPACYKKVVDHFEENFIKAAKEKLAQEEENISELEKKWEMSRGKKCK